MTQRAQAKGIVTTMMLKSANVLFVLLALLPMSLCASQGEVCIDDADCDGSMECGHGNCELGSCCLVVGKYPGRLNYTNILLVCCNYPNHKMQ